MATSLLMDSSFLFELTNARSSKHQQAIEVISQRQQIQVIPDVVLTEVTYLLKERIGQRAVLALLRNLNDPSIRLEAITQTDLKRVAEIIMQYESANLDFVDCCLLAVAERLDITHICTFDRRDFSIFRPRHCEYLHLLP